jgi:diketogulonate reductase-like aldo/keto reductase
VASNAPPPSETAPRSLTDGYRLNQGPPIPPLGLGVFQTEPGAVTRAAVRDALAAGYRLIDTAKLYANEADVGEAVRESGIPRDEIFVTTKLWHSDHGYEAALRAAKESQERLGLGPIDLYLIHWPTAPSPALRLDSWRALEKLHRDGVCRAVGVSNYSVRHLKEILAVSDLVPAVDQVELHPFVYNPELEEFCREKGIRLEAWSPLGRARFFENPTLRRIAEHHGRSPAQVLIRWGLQHGVVEIPKSTHRERIEENARVFDFALSAEEVGALDGLRGGGRVGPRDPADIP